MMSEKKRQRGLMSNEQLQAERDDKIRAKQTRLDRTRLALVYGRQSTERQLYKNKESTRDQCESLIAYAVTDDEWPEALVRAFFENELDEYGNKLDKPRAASGRRDIVFRAGLREAEQLIEADKAGALFVNDVSRLFRDTEMISPPQFARICKQHHCVIITYDQEFDFNATSRDDLKDFLEEAQDAADYLKVLARTMQKRREKKGMRGGYVGHSVPTGLMLDENRENYVPNPLWCETVKQLTRRFRELDADIAALRNEIHDVPIFCELPDDIKSRVGRIQLYPLKDGYTIAGRESLGLLLINPANIGHKVYKGRIVKWDAHPAIVDREDYDFALAHLGYIDLEGNVIEREKRTRRYTQGQRREGLLAGVRENGKPVVTSPQGNVYVFQIRGRTAYTVRSNGYNATYSGSIDIDIVDAAISQRLEDRLHDLVYHAEESEGLIATVEDSEVMSDEPEAQAWGRDIQGKVIANIREQQASARAILDHMASLRQQVRGSLEKVDKTIADIEAKIAFKQREYEAAKHVMAVEDIREHFASLARLRARLADLQKKQAKSAQVDREIEAVKSRLERARGEWESMGLEDKRSFIRLITQDVQLEVMTDRLMKLTIEWHPVLAGITEYTCLSKYRSRGTEWLEEEDRLLQDMYPQATRSDLLRALPSRSWIAIMGRAKEKGISRFTYASGDLRIPKSMALEDYLVMINHGIMQGTGAWQTELGASIIKEDTSRWGVIALMTAKLPLDTDSFNLYNQR
jgi:Resolvase, N terminal domain